MAIILHSFLNLLVCAFSFLSNIWISLSYTKNLNYLSTPTSSVCVNSNASSPFTCDYASHADVYSSSRKSSLNDSTLCPPHSIHGGSRFSTVANGFYRYRFDIKAYMYLLTGSCSITIDSFSKIIL